MKRIQLAFMVLMLQLTGIILTYIIFGKLPEQGEKGERITNAYFAQINALVLVMQREITEISVETEVVH